MAQETISQLFFDVFGASLGNFLVIFVLFFFPPPIFDTSSVAASHLSAAREHRGATTTAECGQGMSPTSARAQVEPQKFPRHS